MRRVLMLGLLMVPGWAGACSPMIPSESTMKAIDAINQAKATQQTACESFKQLECAVYDAPPEKMAEWLKATDKEWKQSGQDWIKTDEQYGRTSTLKSLGRGSVIQTVDVETAWEKLDRRLYNIKPSLWPWPTCRTMGLYDSAYHINSCKWEKLDSQRNMTFNITATTDKSLPIGKYAWMDFGTCGYDLQGPKQ